MYRKYIVYEFTFFFCEKGVFFRSFSFFFVLFRSFLIMRLIFITTIVRNQCVLFYVFCYHRSFLHSLKCYIFYVFLKGGGRKTFLIHEIFQKNKISFMEFHTWFLNYIVYLFIQGILMTLP